MNGHGRWQIAASTLGAVDESFDEIIEILQRHGATAAELRSAQGALVHTQLASEQRAGIRALFQEAGVDVFAVASTVRIASDDDDDTVVGQLIEEIRLAADLGAGFVRVFPGAPATRVPSNEVPRLHEDLDVVDTRAVARFVRVLEVANELGVRPVLETHDSHPRGADVARVLARLDDEHPGHPVGAIWDVLHPWRVGEALTATAEAILPYVLEGRGYVQIKDVAEPSDTTPVLQGQGAVPLGDFLEILGTAGYSGPVSLEWERFWFPEAAPLDDALGAAAAAIHSHEQEQ